MSLVKEYKKGDIAVVWKSDKCINSTNCFTGLPSVFKPQSRPWVQTENASKEEIIAQVEKCPSGALTIKKL